jgi:hypothetical protein
LRALSIVADSTEMKKTKKQTLWLMMQSPRGGFTRVYVSHMFVDVSLIYSPREMFHGLSIGV